MKYKSLIITCLALSLCAHYSHQEKCPIILESEWYNLDHDQSKVEKFGGKWILVGHIIFKKRCKDIICMETIRLHWNGPRVDNLTGSLYKKNSYKESFLPIEENLVCDGIWNEKTQAIIFDFNQETKLGPTNVFYLVLTLTNEVESILKKGYFLLDNTCLPPYFKQRTANEELTLTIADNLGK